jgi:hypothetical protein
MEAENKATVASFLTLGARGLDCKGARLEPFVAKSLRQFPITGSSEVSAIPILLIP